MKGNNNDEAHKEPSNSVGISPGRDEEDVSTDEKNEQTEVSDVPTGSNNIMNGVESNITGRRKTFAAKEAERMARNPKLYLVIGLTTSLLIGVLGMVIGNFSIAVDNEGWRTRGTLISLKQQQIRLLNKMKKDLFNDMDGSVWDDLQQNVQSGIFVRVSARAEEVDKEQEAARKAAKEKENKEITNSTEEINGTMKSSMEVDQCEHSWYESLKIKSDQYTLQSVWKIDPDGQDTSLSALDPQVLKEICLAESKTIAFLEEKGYCFGCPGEKCHKPHSLINMIRDFVQNGNSLECDDLVQAYEPIRSNITNVLVKCTEDIKSNWNPTTKFDLVTNCPAMFMPAVVDDNFGKDNTIIRYTVSYYPTEGKENAKKLFDDVVNLDRGNNHLTLGAYDTKQRFFLESYVNKASQSDMAMCLASAAITALAIITHTRSFWLTFVGILQIMLSFPLAYFIYRFFAGITFFPFLNFIGLFVIFAIGADDIFVAVDKWKNARASHMDATTEEVAGIALPNAAGSMFLTTITTALAFFATAICPVIPIKCFAVFLGLLVVFDYLMNILLVFPALCMYDQWLRAGKSNCCINIERTSKELTIGNDEMEKKESLIHRILNGFYTLLHKLRWPVVLLTMFAIAICAIEAVKFKLPDSARVALLKPNNHFEQHYNWNEKLLSQALTNKAGGSAVVVWGLRPGDTGNYLDPKSGTTLLLDSSFSARSPVAQSYLLSYCKSMFSEDFAKPTTPNYVCPLNAFDSWLKYQNSTIQPDEAYVDNCGGAVQVPVSESIFDQCIIAYSRQMKDTRILQYKGSVQIIFFQAELQARWNSPHNLIGEQYSKIENWLDKQKGIAPPGVNNMFLSSETFVWYDTNNNMMSTAISASIIALVGAASVILLSSRSFMMTLFGSISIMYVLFATIACLIGMGWELGFLESICIAILIGISCDFVIHFGHAYTFFEGSRSREERSNYALTHMGPSILAAAGTTVAAAVIMLFTEISFFRKFATVLFLTIMHSTIAGFLVFIVFADTFGPSQPTKLVDRCVRKFVELFPVKKKSEAPEN